VFADRWLSLPCALIFALSMIQSTRAQTIEPRFAVLVFSKTSGFRHSSIPQGIAAIKTLGAAYGFDVDATEDSARFTDVILANFRAVLFLNTTGTILDADQKAAFERYIRGGGGFVGIHSASDTEYDWPWYGSLVGAYFKSHPEIHPATVRIEKTFVRGSSSIDRLPSAMASSLRCIPGTPRPSLNDNAMNLNTLLLQYIRQ
jgi:type 1 glutamine amidotransferase